MYFIFISKNENEDEKETSSTPFDIILRSCSEICRLLNPLVFIDNSYTCLSTYVHVYIILYTYISALFMLYAKYKLIFHVFA